MEVSQRKGKGTHHSYPMPINICSLILSVFDESNWLKSSLTILLLTYSLFYAVFNERHILAQHRENKGKLYLQFRPFFPTRGQCNLLFEAIYLEGGAR